MSVSAAGDTIVLAVDGRGDMEVVIPAGVMSGDEFEVYFSPF
jgi:hypothetical protein